MMEALRVQSWGTLKQGIRPRTTGSVGLCDLSDFEHFTSDLFLCLPPGLCLLFQVSQHFILILQRVIKMF